MGIETAKAAILEAIRQISAAGVIVVGNPPSPTSSTSKSSSVSAPGTPPSPGPLNASVSSSDDEKRTNSRADAEAKTSLSTADSLKGLGITLAEAKNAAQPASAPAQFTAVNRSAEPASGGLPFVGVRQPQTAPVAAPPNTSDRPKNGMRRGTATVGGI